MASPGVGHSLHFKVELTQQLRFVYPLLRVFDDLVVLLCCILSTVLSGGSVLSMMVMEEKLQQRR